jgi:hypothetical protein
MQERYVMPAVAARAFLKQAEDHNAGLWNALFGQDTSSALVAKAELICKILERVERLRKSIESAPWTPMRRHRANKRLGNIITSLVPERMHDKESAKLETELAELEKWLDPQRDAKQADALYLEDFKSDLNGLMAQATPETFKSHREVVEALRKDIDQALKADPVAYDKLERAYGRLKILWERSKERDDDTFDDLIKLLRQSPDMSGETFFAEADVRAWARLQSARFKFVDPIINKVEPRHAYELVPFRIEPEDPKLGDNFLFKHRITYWWELFLNGKSFTQERTTEPRIVQYAPRSGNLTARVVLSYDGRTAKNAVELPAMPIRRSSDYGFLSIFRLADVAALFFAIVFASITGLATYYFGKYAFGSISDYVALFVWGAGVDQTKNFIQQLGKTSGSNT